MAIFSFLARLGMDTTDFQAGVKRAQSAASGLGKTLNSHVGDQVRGLKSDLASLFTVSAIRSFASRLSDTVGEIKDMAELLGVSTDEVQRMQKAAADAGQPFSVLVNAFNRIEEKRAKALTGDDKASGLFAILGIDPSKGSALEIMRKAVEASGNGAVQSAASFDLLGKKVGAFKVVIDELKNQGEIKLFSEEQIQAIDQSTKALQEASRVFSVTVAPVVTSLLRGLTAILNAPGSSVQMVKDAAGGMSYTDVVEANAQRLLGIRPESVSSDPIPLPDRPTRYSVDARSVGGQAEIISVLQSIDRNTRKAGDALGDRLGE